MLEEPNTGYFHFCAPLETLKLPDLMQISFVLCFSYHDAQRSCKTAFMSFLFSAPCRSHGHASLCASLSSSACVSSSITFASWRCRSVHHFCHLKKFDM